MTTALKVYMGTPIQRSRYLHYWNVEANRWDSEEESKRCNHGDLSFPEIDTTAREYPGGYKFWLPRSLADAPDWVLNARQEKLAAASSKGEPPDYDNQDTYKGCTSINCYGNKIHKR